MSGPTEAMRVEGGRVVRAEHGNMYEGHQSEVDAFTRGMAHAAALIEADLRGRQAELLKRAPGSVSEDLIRASADAVGRCADTVMGGEWLK